ncbi:MAG: hypothetical protein RR060_01905 [Victivallaceae bacterium]
MSENLKQEKEFPKVEIPAVEPLKAKKMRIRRVIYLVFALLILGGGIFYSIRERDYQKFNEIWNRIQAHDIRAVEAWNRIAASIQTGVINDAQTADLLEKEFRSEYLAIDKELKSVDMTKLNEKYLIDFQLLRHITDSWLDISDKLIRGLRSGDAALVKAGREAKDKLLKELLGEDESGDK